MGLNPKFLCELGSQCLRSGLVFSRQTSSSHVMGMGIKKDVFLFLPIQGSFLICRGLPFYCLSSGLTCLLEENTLQWACQTNIRLYRNGFLPSDLFPLISGQHRLTRRLLPGCCPPLLPFSKVCLFQFLTSQASDTSPWDLLPPVLSFCEMHPSILN